ncbi:WxL domain-containing protein [Bombilactobacillus thymidiniphilus]|uniref:WxL domain-containing protein n=1 Tax=Bombilactobacillus thymidiniphilus TaxID=2923363 RepID=A0ABY4PBN3_9LACO|nr:WxL domain-containing protein [Bombilactobacillus thymidiniphilus]UQS83078.1 WxL domain-containing protein [Bombilactobacillus thymidiniphilus]
MRFFKLKGAICAISPLFLVHTVCNVQPILAAEGDAALPALGDSNSASGNSGTSKAGIAFESGDLALVQVPNLDFGTVKLGTEGDMISSKKQQRVAVVTDARIDPGVSDPAFNWNLSVKLGYFYANGDSSTDSNKVDLPLRFSLNPSSTAPTTPARNPIFDPGDQMPVYNNKSGTVINDASVPYTSRGIVSAKGDNNIFWIVKGARRGGTTAVNFGPSGPESKGGYVHIETAAANSDHLQMNEEKPIPYIADLTWTLSSDVTQSN